MANQRKGVNDDLGKAQLRFRQTFLQEDGHSEKSQRFRKTYRLDGVTAGAKDEMEQLCRLNEWVHKQFKKFGRPTCPTENAAEILKRIREGHTFYCAHYTIVMVAAATAMGWMARPVSLRRADYPHRVSNHNVAEIWSSRYKKWIMFDPTWNCHMVQEEQPLNCYEIGRAWIKNKGRRLSFIMGAQRKRRTIHDYPIFIGEYPGFGAIKIDQESDRGYACLAFIPTNRLLGEFPDKSIERWDDWQGIAVILAKESQWKDPVEKIIPYYNIQ